ncbi:TetR/AcrR family transcriptional regulator [Lewinella sp. 4G2]|uniref:TetR/AcrR family transcriptional regulator n=1 Tax=Lewinella sp. 4G2 TaxID=1803372 RepID=UPI0007B48CB6|nr:TetR/AcrR family transcriptional regulator [Lewinella sp. 4G2]OAV46245.1 hypothetical protein A3850_018490 [Lewinella sp. 4G2]
MGIQYSGDDTAKTAQPWLTIGYRIFSQEGPGALHIERLAKQLGKSKSSFYHHFSDREIFISKLLDLHFNRAVAIAVKEKDCENAEGLISILLEHRQDMFFHRALRYHAKEEMFAKCIEAVDDVTTTAVSGVWARITGLEMNSFLATRLYQLQVDSFFLRLDSEDFTARWLAAYFKEVAQMVLEIRRLSA